MKRILFTALCFVALKATSQTIDTAITRCKAAKINSVVISSGFPIVKDTATHLGFFEPINYNTDSFFTVTYVLLNPSKNIVFDTLKVSGNDYATWNGDAASLLGILGRKLNVTFK